LSSKRDIKLTPIDVRFIILISLLITFTAKLNGQSLGDNLSGKVSFASSQNIYVKFKSTDGISQGDTLFIASNGKLAPVLIVTNLSSVSCVCTSISSKNLPISQDIIAKKKARAAKSEIKVTEKNGKEIPAKVVSSDTIKIHPYSVGKKQKINGSISAYSYSDFSNTPAKNATQLRYTYSLDAQNIGNSKFSVENYITFRHKLGDWSTVKNDVFSALKIYTFAIRFDPNKTTRLTLGRTINYRISSMGAMDGLQLEQKLGKVSVGAVVGTRPDNVNYGFNGKLLQYGGYLAFDTKSPETYSESSLAIMQQTNNMKTDRRFLYFQHSNSLLKNLNFFSTFEVDLYKTKNGLPQNTFDLTSLYLSLRYRITKNFSITGSYDQRKNVLFYETYKTLIDSVLENEKRQSFRLQANYRITNKITFGVESGYRFLKSDPHPSKNINGYLTYYQVPGLNVSVTLTGTYLESAFMNGEIYGADISKDLFQGKVQTTIGYRYIDYTLPESKLSVLQNIGEMSIFWQFSKKMSFSANYEGTFEKQDKYNRVYLQIRKRF
jgi:hypothetical protein